MRNILNILILFFTLNCFGQDSNFVYPTINTSADKIENFIPKGWDILSKVRHDFNSDKLLDYAIVFQSQDTIKDSIEGDYSPRLLLIVFQNADKTFKKSLQTNKFFGIGNWGIQSSDPFEKMETDNRYLKLSFSLGGTLRAYETYFFQFKNNEWILSKYSSASYEWWDTKSYVRNLNFLTKTQEDLKVGKKMILNRRITTIDETLRINDLEKRVYKLMELDASNFIDPFLGDSVFD